MENELKEIKKLLQSLLVIELYRGGVVQGEIGKRLHLSKTSVNEVLKGVKRENIS